MLPIDMQKTENIRAITGGRSKAEKPELNNPYYLFFLMKSQEQIWLCKYEVNLRKVPALCNTFRI